MRLGRQVRLPGLLVLVGTMIGAALVGGPAVGEAQAAAGCRVGYSVVSQWQGGFQASVTVTNLGDPLSGWTLAFSFPDAGQQVSQGWSATWSQSGTAVTARSLSWNGALGTGAATDLGFTGSWAGSNVSPAAFTLNGVACTGGATPPTSTPSATASATSSTPATTQATTPATTPATTTSSGDPWTPPGNLTSALAAVWSHEESTYTNLYGFRNYIWDQLMATKGTLNYCVRWDSTATVTAAQRDQIQANLARSFQKWVDQLVESGKGWNNWPYPAVQVKVVGWATRDRNLLQWTDSSVDVTVGDINENAPQCAPPCGRFFHQDNNYSGCPGGLAHHYDMSLWLTDGFNGGAGGDWGQRIGREYFMNALAAGTDNIHILLHEMGHGFGLDDFYDWDPGVGGFIMMAGSATMITEFDKWMLRDWWRHLKSRYGY